MCLGAYDHVRTVDTRTRTLPLYGETLTGISLARAGEPIAPVINPAPEIRVRVSDDEGSEGETAPGPGMVASLQPLSCHAPEVVRVHHTRHSPEYRECPDDGRDEAWSAKEVFERQIE